MMPNAITALAPISTVGGPEALAQASAATGAQGNGGPSFGQMVSQGVDEVNQQLLSSQTDLQELAVGNTQNLHQIMIRLEETRLSFQLFMQVRNRLLEAYQDIMKMQV